MSVTSVSYSGASSNGLDSVNTKKIDLKKILNNLTDEQKDELSSIIKTIQESGSEADIDSLLGNASDELKAAFSDNGAELSKFLEGIKKGVENGGTMPPPPPPDESDSSSSTVSLKLSNFAKVNNAISSLSDDGKDELLDLIKQASLVGTAANSSSGTNSLSSLLSNTSDELQNAFTSQGLDLATFLQNSTKQQSAITSDYSSKLKGQKPPSVDDILHLLSTDRAS